MGVGNLDTPENERSVLSELMDVVSDSNAGHGSGKWGIRYLFQGKMERRCGKQKGRCSNL